MRGGTPRTLENPDYRTYFPLYCKHRAGEEPPPDKKTGKAGHKMEYEIRYVGSHVEVYSLSGNFLFSADTAREAMEELAG